MPGLGLIFPVESSGVLNTKSTDKQVSKLSLLRQLKMQSWAEAESDDESSDSESEDDASEEDAVTPIHRRPPPNGTRNYYHKVFHLCQNTAPSHLLSIYQQNSILIRF